jgi:hypothetical protein
MIKKDDILELHESIVKLKEKQKKARKIAQALISEVESMEDMLESLETDYKILKRKADL